MTPEKINERLNKAQMDINATRTFLDEYKGMAELAENTWPHDRVVSMEISDTYEDFLKALRTAKKLSLLEFKQYWACSDLWLTIEYLNKRTGVTVRFYCRELEKSLEILSEGKCKLKASIPTYRDYSVVCEVGGES